MMVSYLPVQLSPRRSCYFSGIDANSLLSTVALMVQLCYFIFLSFIGFLALKVSKPRVNMINGLQNLDLFFMSVSASTVSSMGTVEMEVFSNQQLWMFIFLMLFGSEAFTSMLGLHIRKARLGRQGPFKGGIDPINPSDIQNLDEECIRYGAIRYLAFFVLSYLATCTLIGSILISLYIMSAPKAREVLETKEIKLYTFSIFMATSSFVNCGFTPTKENMIPFRKHSVLQLLIVSLALAGNTMFPACIRSLVWVLEQLTKSKHCRYILRNSRNVEYEHFFTYRNSVCLASTVSVFVLMQAVLFCLLEWNSETLKGLNPCQKLIGALFQSVNARHAGESIVDMSTVSSAVLVVHVIMMYLPSYTRYLPCKLDDKSSADGEGGDGRSLFQRGVVMSQLGFLTIFIVLICITERRAMIEDPLNFSVLNIVFEVISAYGNVGFSLGYSCRRLLAPDSSCKEAWYGFAGRWSTNGKLILILVMLFGRLKMFSINGGKAWKLK